MQIKSLARGEKHKVEVAGLGNRDRAIGPRC
jgi:hypothetical protein